MKVNLLKVFVLMCVALFTVNTSCSSKKSKTAETKVVGVGQERRSLDTTKKVQATTLSTVPAVVTKEPVVKKEEIQVNLPAVPREFRAAWIATVANINWPSKRNLTTEQQKMEAVQLLDFLRDHNFNAVIFQVRPSADALYNSAHEPWSYFLTGEIGKQPTPYYDPLEFWVEEAHKRGLELHVWLNPYRAHHSNGGTVTNQSMAVKAKDHVVRLKNGMYWFDPADVRTQDHASRVVNDIVKRYDIDGVHFDDYFYPYASYNGGADFPDDKTWNAYRKEGGNLSRGDWRRDHVNRFIKRIYGEIKAEKNYVKFGLSPFGIWKPGYPRGVRGSSQYDELYADAKLWLNEGWVDYFAPQLYWPIEPTAQSFPALLRWWQEENTHQRHLWPGLNTVAVKSTDRSSEIINQVDLVRDIVPASKGEIHWSIAGLLQSPELMRKLKEGPYAHKALVPTSPWLQANPLLQPTLLLTNNKGTVFAKWIHQQPEQVYHWVLYTQYGQDWEVEVLLPGISAMEVPKTKNGKKLTAIAVKAIDRLGNESEYIAKAVE